MLYRRAFRGYAMHTRGTGLGPMKRLLRLALGDQLGQGRFVPVGVALLFLAQILDDQISGKGNRADHPKPNPDLLGPHDD
ncbi:hypothetical protein UU5_05276 [Rhodanobacter sp. 115]|nr:hypothetical protein UU5_05276 [Rhodanobacter sp. 115]